MVTKIDGDPVTPSLIGKSGHVMYNVLDTPNAPMDTTWVEVLDYACVWADDCSTEVQAATKVAESLYNNLGIVYDEDQQYTRGAYHEEFELITFLDDVGDDIVCNCNDMANLFCIFSSAVGCDSQTKELYGNMYTYGVKLVGKSYATYPTFGLHHFGWVDNNRVYDACLLLYYESNYIEPYNMELATFKGYLYYSGSPTELTPVTTVIVDPL
jgi:hypothetical protein